MPQPISRSLPAWFNRIVAWSEAWVSSPRWRLKVFVLSAGCSVFFSAGLDDRLLNDGPQTSDNHGFAYGYSEGYYKKIENPWLDVAKLFPSGSHDAKLNFRLTVPVVLHYLGLRAKWVLPLLTITATCAILLLACQFAYRVTRDRVTSLFVSLGVASTFTGSFAFVAYYDAIAIAQLAFALLPGLNPWLKGLLVFTASFTDERAFIAAAFLLVPELCATTSNAIPGRPWFLRPGLLATLAGLALYSLARILLIKCAGFSAPTTGVSFYLFLIQLNFLHAGIWFALEGGWLLVLLALLILIRERRSLALAVFLGSMAAILLGAFMVADVLRSGAYLFPALLVSLLIIARQEEVRWLRIYCFIAFLVSLAGGNYNVFGDRIVWFKPLLASLFEFLCRLFFIHH